MSGLLVRATSRTSASPVATPSIGEEVKESGERTVWHPHPDSSRRACREGIGGRQRVIRVACRGRSRNPSRSLTVTSGETLSALYPCARARPTE